MSDLKKGTRVCAYWSEKYHHLFPGTVGEPIEEGGISCSSPTKSTSNKKVKNCYVSVELDDGDDRAMHINQIRFLPPGYPIVSKCCVCLSSSCYYSVCFFCKKVCYIIKKLTYIYFSHQPAIMTHWLSYVGEEEENHLRITNLQRKCQVMAALLVQLRMWQWKKGLQWLKGQGMILQQISEAQQSQAQLNSSQKKDSSKKYQRKSNSLSKHQNIQKQQNFIAAVQGKQAQNSRNK